MGITLNNYYKTYNAYSCEIDNIDSSYIGEDVDKLTFYYVELYNNLKSKDIKTKLMMKNLSEKQLQSITKLVDSANTEEELLAIKCA